MQMYRMYTKHISMLLHFTAYHDEVVYHSAMQCTYVIFIISLQKEMGTILVS